MPISAVSKAASLLGRKSKGIPKKLSADERKRRAEQMRRVRQPK